MSDVFNTLFGSGDQLDAVQMFLCVTVVFC